MLAQTITIPAGAKGLDFVAPPVPETQLVADGWKFGVCYVARRSGLPKILTSDRIARAHDAGLPILGNYEAGGKEAQYGDAKRPTDGLSAYDDGLWARQYLTNEGYPVELPVLCSSFDFDPRYVGGMDAAIAYGLAFHEGAGSFGPYGGIPIIDALGNLSTLNWQAMAPSWSKDPNTGYWLTTDATIHARQRRPSLDEQAAMTYCQRQADGSFLVDVNVALSPFDAWLPHTVPDPIEDDMIYPSRHERLLDTRKAGPAGKVLGGTVYRLSVNHLAVKLRLTVVPSSPAGFLSVAGEELTPEEYAASSAANWSSYQVWAGDPIIGTPDGVLRIYASDACHLIVDLQAYKD